MIYIYLDLAVSLKSFTVAHEGFQNENDSDNQAENEECVFPLESHHISDNDGETENCEVKQEVMDVDSFVETTAARRSTRTRRRKQIKLYTLYQLCKKSIKINK